MRLCCSTYCIGYIIQHFPINTSILFIFSQFWYSLVLTKVTSNVLRKTFILFFYYLFNYLSNWLSSWIFLSFLIIFFLLYNNFFFDSFFDNSSIEINCNTINSYLDSVTLNIETLIEHFCNPFFEQKWWYFVSLLSFKKDKMKEHLGMRWILI